MNSIDPLTLREKIDNKEDMVFIDVREPWEHELFNIGGLLIPMNTVFQNLHKIPADKPVIIYCQKGIRSGLVIQRLQQKYHYNNLYNLTGGMDGWSKTLPGNKNFTTPIPRK
jgi:adenylyltransferase/sulfurtransferase